MTARVFNYFSFDNTALNSEAAPIKPREPMAFPDSVIPEFIRDDVVDAVIDALAMRNNPPPADANVYEVEFFDLMGYSDPVTLAPLELRF